MNKNLLDFAQNEINKTGYFLIQSFSPKRFKYIVLKSLNWGEHGCTICFWYFFVLKYYVLTFKAFRQNVH